MKAAVAGDRAYPMTIILSTIVIEYDTTPAARSVQSEGNIYPTLC
jgi:hypothetical protein